MRELKRIKALVPMEQVSFFILYGTLQKEFGLRAGFPRLIDLDDCFNVYGYDMYSLGGYPYVVKNNLCKRPIKATLAFTTDPQTILGLNEVELGAGYTIANISFAMYSEYFDILEKHNVKIDPMVTVGNACMYVFGQGRHIKMQEKTAREKIVSKNWREYCLKRNKAKR